MRLVHQLPVRLPFLGGSYIIQPFEASKPWIAARAAKRYEILDLYRAESKGESLIGLRRCKRSINVNGRSSTVLTSYNLQCESLLPFLIMPSTKGPLYLCLEASLVLIVFRSSTTMATQLSYHLAYTQLQS